MVSCGFCGRPFEEDRAQPACERCPLSVACKAVRCPHCGYENPAVPAAPAWLTRLRHLTRSHPPRGTR